MDKVPFTGTIISVKARIRLLRSFDQIPTHQYQGYTLLLNGEIDGDHREQIKIGIGPKAQDEHQFRIGDQICGLAVPVADQKTEWAEYYKVSGLKLLERSQKDNMPPNPEGGVTPPLEVYRSQGHLRLQRQTCETKCFRCPFGLTMATQMIIDHWDPSNVKWRLETHCGVRKLLRSIRHSKRSFFGGSELRPPVFGRCEVGDRSIDVIPAVLPPKPRS